MIDVQIFNDCDPSVAECVRQLNSAVTSSHTLLERGRPVWKILRDIVDRPALDAIGAYQGKWDQSILNGFLPSRMGKPPNGTRTNSSRKAITPHEVAINNIEKWRRRLIAAADSADKHKPFTKSLAQFSGTLGTLISLADSLQSIKPKRFRTFEEREKAANYLEHNSSEFCRLCWKPTQFQSKMDTQWLEMPKSGPGRNKNYCEDHLPGEESHYRRDKRYRALFEHEIEAYSFKYIRSNFPYLRPKPADWSAQEIRKAAYLLVRSKATPKRALIYELCVVKKMSQSDAALRLGITKQAVSKMLGEAICIKQSLHEQVWKLK